MAGSVILAGARTPIGKLSGALASFSAAELGGFAITAALERAGLTPEQIDYVFMGQVIQAGAGQMTARQNVLVNIDRGSQYRKSQENPDLLRLYDEFYGEPNSPLAHDLLHTTFAPFRDQPVAATTTPAVP